MLGGLAGSMEWWRFARHPRARRRVHVRRAAGPVRAIRARHAAATSVRSERRHVGCLGRDHRAGSGRRADGTLGWRWVFWINLPMIVVVAWAARLALRRTRSRRRPGERPLNVDRTGACSPVGARLLLAADDTGSAPVALVPAVLFFFHERQHPVAGVHAPPDLAGRERRGVLRGRGLPGRRGVSAATAPGRPGRADLGGRGRRWCWRRSAGRRGRWAPPGWGRASASRSSRERRSSFAGTLAMAVPAGGPVLPIARPTASPGWAWASPRRRCSRWSWPTSGRAARDSRHLDPAGPPGRRRAGHGDGRHRVRALALGVDDPRGGEGRRARAGGDPRRPPHVPAAAAAGRDRRDRLPLAARRARAGARAVAREVPVGSGTSGTRRQRFLPLWHKSGGRDHCRSRPTSCAAGSGSPTSGRASARRARPRWPAATCSRSCPPASGKSLCYQLPALIDGRLTLVVSPLIALMQDQCAALRARGLDGVEMIASSMTSEAVAETLARVRGR